MLFLHDVGERRGLPSGGRASSSALTLRCCGTLDELLMLLGLRFLI